MPDDGIPNDFIRKQLKPDLITKLESSELPDKDTDETYNSGDTDCKYSKNHFRA